MRAGQILPVRGGVALSSGALLVAALFGAILGLLPTPACQGDVLSFDVPQPVEISPNGTPLVSINSQPAPNINSIDSVSITLDHEWLGDLTIKLVPPIGSSFTLFSRIGVTVSDIHGSSAILGSFLPSSDPSNPVFTLVPETYQFARFGTDLTTEAANEVLTSDPAVIGTNHVYAAQSWGSGPFTPGTWQLLISDEADLSGGLVSEAHLNYTAGSSQVAINWQNPSDMIYGTALSAAQLNATATANGVPVAGTFSYSPSAGTVLQAGLHTLSVTFVPVDSASYGSTSASVQVTVRRAALTVNVDAKTMAYGASLPPFTATYSGFVNGDGPNSLTQPVGFTTTAQPSSPVGTYAIVGTGGASPNYSINLVNGTLTIAKAILLVIPDDQTKPYGAAIPALTATYSGFVNGDTVSSLTQPVSLTTTARPTSPAGPYPITATGGFSPNYSLVPKSGTLTVTPAPLTVTVDAKTRPYGAANPAFTATYTGFVNGDTLSSLTQPVTLSTTANARSPVGTYAIVASGGASPNYTMLMNNGSLTVTKAQLTVTADTQSKAYGAPLPTLTATYTGFLNGDTVASLTQPVSLSTAASVSSPVGAYPIIATGGASPNYALSYNNGTLNVTKAVLTVRADNQSRPYGAANPPLTASYSGFVNGETVASLNQPATLTTLADKRSPVGTYPITVSGAVSPNYNIVPVSGVMNVTQATLTLTVDAKTRSYGAPNPALTGTYSGFVNGDGLSSLTQPVTLSTVATGKSPVGNYPILATGGASPNYTLSVISGNLTITKAPLTVTADNQTKAYGAPVPLLTATYAGFVNGDTVASLSKAVTLTTTALPESSVGTYPIEVSGGLSANYDFRYNAGTLNVTKAILTVTADNQTRPYGAVNPVFTATYSGFVNGDTSLDLSQRPTLSTTAIATSPVGSYPITLSGAVGLNYNIIFRSGTLAVTKAPLTITADDKARVYGGSDPVLTATYDGFAKGETSAVISPPVTLSTTATSRSPAGTYPITATSGSSLNYALIFKPGTLTVHPKELTVVASNKSKTYGAPLPDLTATYTGFVNGDTASVLTPPPTPITTATAVSPVGSYPIQFQGGSSPNYSFNFQNGTLTVTKAPLIIRVDNKVKPVGAPLPTFTVSYDGFVNGDNFTSLSQPIVFATTATKNSPLGVYPIIASGAEAPNYTITLINGTLTVSDEPQPPVFEPESIQRAPDGSISVGLSVASGTKLRLDSSSNLSTWTELGSQVSTNGQVLFRFKQRSQTIQQFFRGVLVP